MNVVDLTFFGTFFASLDAVLTAFTNQAVANMAQYVSTAVRIFGIVVLILAAIQLAWAPFPTAITRYGRTLALIALVSNVATVPATYNELIGNFLRQFPDELLMTIDPQGMGDAEDPDVLLTNVGQYLDQKIGSILTGIVAMWGDAGLTDIGGALLSMVMFVLCCLLAVSALIAITVGKVGMALVVAVGPLVIMSLISEKSRDFFSKWVSYAMNLAMLQLLIGGVLLISDNILTTYTAILVSGTSPKNMAGMFAPAVAMFLLTYLFGQLPSMASSLTGGIGLSTGNFAWDTLNRQRSFGSGDKGNTGQKNQSGGAGAGGGTVSQGQAAKVDPRAANAVMRGSHATRRREVDAGGRGAGPSRPAPVSGTQNALARLMRDKQGK